MDRAAAAEAELCVDDTDRSAFLLSAGRSAVGVVMLEVLDSTLRRKEIVWMHPGLDSNQLANAIRGLSLTRQP